MTPWFISPTKSLQETFPAKRRIRGKPLRYTNRHLRVIRESSDLPISTEQFGYGFQRENLIQILERFANISRRLRFNRCTDDVPNHSAEQSAGEFVLKNFWREAQIRKQTTVPLRRSKSPSEVSRRDNPLLHTPTPAESSVAICRPRTSSRLPGPSLE